MRKAKDMLSPPSAETASCNKRGNYDYRKDRVCTVQYSNELEVVLTLSIFSTGYIIVTVVPSTVTILHNTTQPPSRSPTLEAVLKVKWRGDFSNWQLEHVEVLLLYSRNVGTYAVSLAFDDRSTW
jgi:hypothetical protein